MKQLVEHRYFQRFIVGLIILNAITLGMETSGTITQRWGEPLQILDTIILWIFVVEIALRIAVYRTRFFTNGWSLFDFFVVGIAFLPESGAFSVLRALRVLRVLRLLSTVPQLQKIVASLLSVIPSLGYITALMGVVFYVSSVIATKLFGDAFPKWFGTLGESMFTLFQIMTLEGWAMELARPVMEVYPWAWAYFLIFILITTFTVLNLFIAVIVNALQSEQEELMERTSTALKQSVKYRNLHTEETLQEEISALREEMQGLKELIKQQRQ